VIDIDREGERLVISQGPSAWYRIATWGWGISIASAAILSAALGRAWLGGLAASGCLVLGCLVGGWCETECCFDRREGLLTVARQRPWGTKMRREVPLANVSSLVDRRSTTARAIELVLDDRSVLVVARARALGIFALDLVARRISELLRKPVEYTSGALIAKRFAIERLVQWGGMGVVYKALDRATGQPVAVKLIQGTSHAADHAARFAREIEILASIDHPRVARHVAHGQTGEGETFLAMEWLEGEDLRSRLARGALSPRDSLTLLKRAAEAVATAHERGVVHRDLKPSNLFLRGGDASDLVLLDFGVARRLGDATRLTASSTLVGTPQYMAPEQVASPGDLTPAVDVFSLGGVFYECLTGKHPFESELVVGVLARILFDAPEPVEAHAPNVPPEWSRLLERMLAKRAADRPSDARALLKALDELPAPASNGREVMAELGESTALEAADSVLVCVVLVNLPAGMAAQDRDVQVQSMRSGIERFGCVIEQLVDGSLLVAILPQYGATDLVRIAARSALYLRERLPGAQLAIATGKAPGRRNPRVGNAVDKAVQLLEGSMRESVGTIRLDSITAGLLEGHFATRLEDGKRILLDEQLDSDSNRLLLGKPTPCVGRDVELLQLERLAASALGDGTAKASVVVGLPGIGKSRLRRELLRRVEQRFPDATTLIGQGDPLSEGSPYVLLAEALRRHVGVSVGEDPDAARAAIRNRLCAHVAPGDLPRVSELLGELTGVHFPAEGSPRLVAARGDHRVMSEQIALAFSDWLAAECLNHPVILVLEDTQWGDALTLKVLERTLRDLAHSRLFVIAFARPELYESFPNPLGNQVSLSLSLTPLSDAASAHLITSILGTDLGEDAIRTMTGLAGGNALFLEELIRAAAQGKAGDVPETVLAILQARLSRLSSEERAILRAASILGETFWVAGVRRVVERWGVLEPIDAWLEQLTIEEFIEPCRFRQFAAETEYRFRHALVRDAALGLLAESERRAGHLLACDWLESVGEPDAVVLARHAEQGGAVDRALSFYIRAAEQSLAQYDFVEALARATRGIACGADGESLGTLRGIEALSYYSQGQFADAATAGNAALDLAPRGGRIWCATAETLLQVLPNVGAMDQSETLSRALADTRPASDATTAYLRALWTQVLPYSLGGARQMARACLVSTDTLVDAASSDDVVARGYSRLWHAVLEGFLGDDLAKALELAKQAASDLTECQVMFRVSLAHSLSSLVLRGLGDFSAAEHAGRRARVVADAVHDDYHAALGAWYVGLALAEHSDAAKLEEAEACAAPFMGLEGNPLVHAAAHAVTTRVALERKDWGRALAHGHRARAGLLVMPPLRFLATPSVIYAALARGQVSEANDVALEDLALLERIGSPVITDVPLLVAGAEAVRAAGETERANRLLREALAQIDGRAAHLHDDQMRQTYLTQRRENRRAFELRDEYLQAG
jgi:tetratricopeptide (TPR) repeat protein